MKEKFLTNREVKDLLFKRRKEISAIVPIYNERGKNCSKLILKDNFTVTTNFVNNTLLDNVATTFGTKPDLVRERYKGLFNCIVTPLPLSIKVMLIPLRVRNKLKNHDGVYGYFNFYHLNGLEKSEISTKKSYLTLNESIELELLQGHGTAKEKIQQGVIAGQYFRYNNDYKSGFEELEHYLNMSFPEEE